MEEKKLQFIQMKDNMMRIVDNIEEYKEIVPDLRSNVEEHKEIKPDLRDDIEERKEENVRLKIKFRAVKKKAISIYDSFFAFKEGEKESQQYSLWDYVYYYKLFGNELFFRYFAAAIDELYNWIKKWQSELIAKYPVLSFIFNWINQALLDPLYKKGIEEAAKLAVKMVDWTNSIKDKLTSTFVKKKIAFKERKEKGFKYEEKFEERVEETEVYDTFEPPENDPFDQRFGLLFFRLGDYILGEVGGVSETFQTYRPKYCPGEYFRQNGWLVTFRFPSSFIFWIEGRGLNDEVFASYDFLSNKEIDLYGYEEDLSILFQLLCLSLSVRMITLPSRGVGLDSFKTGNPIRVSLPTRINEDDFGTFVCHFYEISRWVLFDRYFKTIPAYVLFRHYLDWASGLPDSTLSMKYWEGHRRMPIPPLDASILVTIYLFDMKAPTFELASKKELDKLFNYFWAIKMLAVPLKVEIETDLQYRSGEPIMTRVDFHILYSHAMTLITKEQGE